MVRQSSLRNRMRSRLYYTNVVAQALITRPNLDQWSLLTWKLTCKNLWWDHYMLGLWQTSTACSTLVATERARRVIRMESSWDAREWDTTIHLERLVDPFANLQIWVEMQAIKDWVSLNRLSLNMLLFYFFSILTGLGNHDRTSAKTFQKLKFLYNFLVKIVIFRFYEIAKIWCVKH